LAFVVVVVLFGLVGQLLVVELKVRVRELEWGEVWLILELIEAQRL
jgi:hypothetical protein